MDNDNLVKPVQDALIGLVYEDDRSITDTSVRKTPLDGPVIARGITPALAEGFMSNQEFLHICVEPAPRHEVLLR